MVMNWWKCKAYLTSLFFSLLFQYKWNEIKFQTYFNFVLRGFYKQQKKICSVLNFQSWKKKVYWVKRENSDIHIRIEFCCCQRLSVNIKEVEEERKVKEKVNKNNRKLFSYFIVWYMCWVLNRNSLFFSSSFRIFIWVDLMKKKA